MSVLSLLLGACVAAQYVGVESPREPLPLKSPRAEAIVRVYAELSPQEILAQNSGPSRHWIENLDADADLEHLLVFQQAQFDEAVVMKRIDGKWWILGRFLSRRSSELGAFVSLRQLVWSGTHDLIVRAGGSQGTGVGATTQSVYRIFQGNLYNVFEVVDGSWNWTSSTSARVDYPDDENRGSIRVYRKAQKGSSTCSIHRWIAAQFVFGPARPCPRP